MTIYAYQSMDEDGRIVRGNMDAVNLSDLELRLKKMGLDLIDSRQMASHALVTGRGRIRPADLINFCFHMEQLTSAGVPLLDGLSDLRDSSENPRFRAVVADLIENIEGGSQLSEAMERYPDVFDNTFSALIRAGERSGQLAQVFKNLSDGLKWQDELRAQTRKIIMYPAFVGTVVLGVTVFLMVFLVPQLIGFIKTMGGELPLHTRALIFVSNTISDYWYVFLILPVVGVLGMRTALKNYPAVRFWYDGVKLRLVLVGPIQHKIILSRFTTFFALMYGAGITVLDAIQLSEKIVGNVVVADGLRRAGQLISEGQTVTSAFDLVGIFPPLVVRMLKIGEATGRLDAALLNVSYFYNREIREMIERVQALIEPIMTVVLGVILGWVMLSVLGPIYDMISKIQA